MSNCSCEMCARHNRWREAIMWGDGRSKEEVFSEMLDLILDLEMDRDFDQAVLTGSLGDQSIEILERRAAKLLSLAEQFKNKPLKS